MLKVLQQAPIWHCIAQALTLHEVRRLRATCKTCRALDESVYSGLPELCCQLKCSTASMIALSLEQGRRQMTEYLMRYYARLGKVLCFAERKYSVSGIDQRKSHALDSKLLTTYSLKPFTVFIDFSVRNQRGSAALATLVRRRKALRCRIVLTCIQQLELLPEIDCILTDKLLALQLLPIHALPKQPFCWDVHNRMPLALLPPLRDEDNDDWSLTAVVELLTMLM
jgi:hypothetical protein